MGNPTLPNPVILANRLRRDLTLDAPYPAPALVSALLSHFEGTFHVHEANGFVNARGTDPEGGKTTITILPGEWDDNRKAEGLAALVGMHLYLPENLLPRDPTPAEEKRWILVGRAEHAWALRFAQAFLSNEGLEGNR